jgi:hypothetical protein
VKRGTLRKLAGNNANPLKPEESKDFKKIKKLVERYRDEIRQYEKLQTIKKLIEEAENGDIESRTAIEKIKITIA